MPGLLRQFHEAADAAYAQNKKAMKTSGKPFRQDLHGPTVPLSAVVSTGNHYARMKPWSPSKAHEQLHAIALNALYSYIHSESLSRLFTRVSLRKSTFDHRPFPHSNGHVFRTTLLMSSDSKISNINLHSRAFWSLLRLLQSLTHENQRLPENEYPLKEQSIFGLYEVLTRIEDFRTADPGNRPTQIDISAKPTHETASRKLDSRFSLGDLHLCERENTATSRCSMAPQ